MVLIDENDSENDHGDVNDSDDDIDNIVIDEKFLSGQIDNTRTSNRIPTSTTLEPHHLIHRIGTEENRSNSDEEGDEEEAEEEDDDTDGSLPALEDVTSSDDEGNHCWVCFATDRDEPNAEWVQPCKCSGSVGFVHQKCIKRWVEEKRKGTGLTAEVSCPHCETKYTFEFPPKDQILQITTIGDSFVRQSVSIICIVTVAGAVYIVCTTYSRYALSCVFDDEWPQYSKDCLTLDPYISQFQHKIQTKFSDLFFKIFFYPFHEQVRNVAVKFVTHESPVLSIMFTPIHKIGRFILNVLPSLYIPFVLYKMRNIKWDEGLLNYIDKLSKKRPNDYSYPSGNTNLRTILGGWLMPFWSRLCGECFFAEEESPVYRFLYGMGTYLTVKGAITIVRKYKLRNWQRRYKIKDYIEGDDDGGADANNIPFGQGGLFEIDVQW